MLVLRKMKFTSQLFSGLLIMGFFPTFVYGITNRVMSMSKFESGCTIICVSGLAT